MSTSSGRWTLPRGGAWPGPEPETAPPTGTSRPRATAPARDEAVAAPDRFRSHYGDVLAIALMLSVAAHFALFRFFRGFGVPELELQASAITSVELPPEVEIPPPPEAVARPATPTVATVEVNEEITIALTTFEANPVEGLPPPPEAGTRDPSERPHFIPFDTPPRLRNGSEIQRLLVTEFPTGLRAAGIGGTVVIWLYVDSNGAVGQTLVKVSSGHSALDAAAGRVGARMVFEPALNRDKPTAVWVSQSITFAVH